MSQEFRTRGLARCVVTHTYGALAIVEKARAEYEDRLCMEIAFKSKRDSRQSKRQRWIDEQVGEC